MDEEGLVRVTVRLNLSVDALIDGTPETKSIIEPDVVPSLTDDAQIKNIVVLQFNGTTSTARLVGGQAYFDHWPLNGYRETTDPLYDVNDKLTLVASATANTVVVLANTFDRISISSGTTLGQFLAQDYTTISGLSGVLTTSGGDDYFRLSGSQKLNEVSGVTNVSIALKRNVAKIVVNITNNTFSNSGDNKVTISKVHLTDINAKYYYLTHIGAGLDASVAFSDTYSEAYPFRFDNDQEAFAAAGNTGTTQTYTYYVPANLRGTTSNTQQYSKSQGAPAGATCFRIYGTYGDSHTPIIYTYYLGGNLTNDFNILPNYKYTYNITINTKGNPNYDYRIDDMKEIKEETDANCYMLHPPVVDGLSRIYAIPVRRAAVFWNEEGVYSGVYGASTLAGYSSYKWDGSTNWTAEVLWSDFDLSPYTGDNAFLVSSYSTGTGFDPKNTSPTNKPYFKVRVSAGMNGNVVVGVKVNGVIMWSWHLWITDYDPDKTVVPVAGKYIYGVENGEIHRYNNDLFNSTEADEDVISYKNGFFMDRNLGAIGTTVNSYRSYGLYYQWGRKDPFAWGTTSGTNNKFYLGGTESANILINSANDPSQRAARYNHEDLPADQKNIRYTVSNPMVFIHTSSPNMNSGNWTVIADDLSDGGNNTYVWNDRKFWEHYYGNQEILEAKKSIYDPCPPGWKIPVRNFWSGFTLKNAGNEEAGTFTTVWADGGRYYYPEGYVARNSTGAIYLPATGFRMYHNGGTVAEGRLAMYWASDFVYVYSPPNLYFRETHINSNYDYNLIRSSGITVRCVRE